MADTWRGGLVTMLILSALVGCDGGGGGVFDESDINFSQLQLQMTLDDVASFLQTVDPLSPAAPPATLATAEAVCLDATPNICHSGRVLNCDSANPEDRDIVVEQCMLVYPSGATTVFEGTITYSPEGQWPWGTFTVVIADDRPGNITYGMTFEGGGVVGVDVNDTVNDIRAVCTGSLVEPFEAQCQLT